MSYNPVINNIIGTPPTTLFTQTSTQTVSTNGVSAATETTIIGSGTGSLIIPANYLVVGKVLRISVKGLYSTPTLNVGNVIVKNKLGSTVVSSGTVTSLLATATNLVFKGETYITCRSIGTGGTIMVQGSVEYAVATSNASPFTMPLNNGLSTISIDTTIAQTYDLTILYSNNTLGNSISSTNITLEALN